MALRTLTIDLARGHVRQQLPAMVERDYLGGRGAVAWLLWHHLPPDTPALAPANLLIFAAGRLAGNGAFAAGGFVVGTRSPLTGAIGYSWAQGHWGEHLRRAGYDLLIIRGQAPEWVYIYLDRDQVRLRPAAHLVGLDTLATHTALRSELGSDVAVACIGPAGEADVAYASIVAEGRYIAEPAGTGIVMATKRIKAVVVRGGPPGAPADPARLTAALASVRRRSETSAHSAAIRRVGDLYLVARAAAQGALSGQNGAVAHPGTGLVQAIGNLANRRGPSRGCTGCPMPCYHDLVATGEPLPTLEMVTGFGARCGISNPDHLAALAEHCLRLGLDPVATSAAVAFLMECQARGLSRSTRLAWGDGPAVLAAVERLAQRQEKRDLLSLGIGELQAIFWGSDAFAPQARGLAMPALDPRALNGMALAMATAPIGGDPRYAMAYEELVADLPPWLPEAPNQPRTRVGKALRLIWHERFAAALDATGLCRRLGLLGYQVAPGELLALIAATGITLTGADLAKIGERIITVEQLFARRYADSGAEAGLPARWTQEALTSGPAAGHLPPLAELIAEYYQRHGWDPHGDPTPARLAELGIRV